MQANLKVSAIQITMMAPPGADTNFNVPGPGAEYCTGIHFEKNTFEKCYTCPTSWGGSLISVQCVNYGAESNEDDMYPTTDIDHTAHPLRISSSTYDGVTYNVDLNNNVFT